MELSIALLNFSYAIFGALLTLGFMAAGYKLFDKFASQCYYNLGKGYTFSVEVYCDSIINFLTRWVF